MTAASAYPPESAEGRSAEPSMEDILASIRRIIADDQNGAGGPASPAATARRTEAAAGERSVARARTPYDDVLDLARLVPSLDRGSAPTPPTTPMQPNGEVAAYPSEAHEPVIANGTSSLRARLPEPAGHGQAKEEDTEMLDHPVPALGDEGEEDLLAQPLGDSVMSAFETLAATVVLQNTPMLERVMRDLLRPMLKTWLDDNLPKLVERLVRNEIERVARGTRG